MLPFNGAGRIATMRESGVPVAPRVTGARLEIVAALVYLAAMMRTYILALAIGLAGAGAAIAEPLD